jgi:SAM-dependent methyltransferase
MKSIDVKYSKNLFAIVECNDCRFKFTNPRPTFDEIAPFYGDNYYSYQQPAAKGIKQPSTGKKILDYGCGAGQFLLEKVTQGYEGYGVDISDSAIQRGKKLGLTIKRARKDKIDFDNDFFDVIRINHVLEHVHELQAIMAEINRCLKPRGELWIEVPNIDSYDAQIFGPYWRYLDVPRHLYHFDVDSLQRLLQINNFYIVNINTAHIPKIDRKLDYIKGLLTVIKMKMATTRMPFPLNILSGAFFVFGKYFSYAFHVFSSADGNLIRVRATKL